MCSDISFYSKFAFSCCLMIMDIFSCAYLSIVALFGESPMSLPTFTFFFFFLNVEIDSFLYTLEMSLLSKTFDQFE